MSPKLRLLIVDDEQFNLMILAGIFEDTEFETVTACDGADALEKLAAMPRCDAVLVDWMMPNLDGIELLKRMKSDPRYCRIPAIMQTARGAAENIQEATAAGADAYVVKPYNEAKMLDAVRSALRKAKEQA